MLTAFLLVQLAVNAALVCGLLLLVRERRGAARLTAEREARLEALARELCDLAREMTRPGDRGAGAAPLGARPAPAVPHAARPQPEESGGGRIPEVADPLAQGDAATRVAARTALSEGEIQLLRNLHRRPPRPAAPAPPAGPAREAGVEAAVARKRRPRAATVARSC